MSADKLSPQARADVEALRERNRLEREALLACPDPSCRALMNFVTTLDFDSGMGSTHLYQCPQCKLIETKDLL